MTDQLKTGWLMGLGIYISINPHLHLTYKLSKIKCIQNIKIFNFRNNLKKTKNIIKFNHWKRHFVASLHDGNFLFISIYLKAFRLQRTS